MKIRSSVKRRLMVLMVFVGLIAPMLMAFAPMQEGGIFEAIDWPAVIDAFISAKAFGIPIILLVIGFTYGFGKWFGVQGKWQFVTAIALGLVFGGGYQAVTASLGYSWQAWFFYIVYGLLQGLISSLLYDTSKDLITKIVQKLLGTTVLEVGLDETIEKPS